MKHSTIIKAWETVDLIEHLKRWLSSPYAFQAMEDSEKAVEMLDWIESFFRAAAAGEVEHLQKWDDNDDEYTLDETMQEVERILDKFNEWELTEEAYLDQLEADREEAAILADDIGVIKIRVNEIREAI